MNIASLSFTTAFNLNNSPNNLTLTDTTDYATEGIATSQVSGVFELTSPVGIFHSNTNYASPDIARVSTDHFDHDLPLDSLNRVLTGDYSLKYSIFVAAEQLTYDLIGISTLAQTFYISGDYVSEILNAIGGTFDVIGSSPNVGTYTVVSATYDTVNLRTEIVVVEVIPSSSYGTDQIQFTADQTYTVTNAVNFCYQEPTISLEITHDCKYSQLVSWDVSTYAANICGTTYSPIVINRTHTIKYPQGITPAKADIVGTAAKLTVNNIYTKQWTVIVSTVVTYQLATGVTLTMTVSAMQYHDVDCDAGLCCIYTCIKNLYDNWLAYKGTNLVEANRYKDKLDKVIGMWMLYSISENCGETDQEDRLTDLIELVKSTDCYCCGSTTDLPIAVVPLISAGSGDTVIVTSSCSNGIVVTATTVGTTTTYDVCLDTTIINSYITLLLNAQTLGGHSDTVLVSPVNKQVVAWDSGTSKWKNYTLGLHDMHDVDLVTNPPANGYALTWNSALSKAEFLPTGDKVRLLYSDFTDSSTSALTPTLLKTYTATVIPVTNGDYVDMEAWIQASSLSDTKTVTLRMGAVTIATLVWNNTTIPFTDGVINAKIYKTGTGTGYAIITFTYKNGLSEYTSFLTVPVSPTSNIISVYGNTSNVATSVTCKLLRVTAYQQ